MLRKLLSEANGELDFNMDDEDDAEIDQADDQPSEQDNPDELDFDMDDADEENPSDVGDDTPDDTESNPEGSEDAVDSVIDAGSEDPNKAGVIRQVVGARLVYKRREPSQTTYEELWVYSLSDVATSMVKRRAILAGTDISYNRSLSDDGSQKLTIWSPSGNTEFLHLSGLPN
jgi:hypothetical protein